MLTISNGDIKLHILEPGNDPFVKNPRYCAGAYIWQVEHASKGDLMTGPFWPDQSPPLSDGQGLPDVFQPTLHPVDTPDGDPVLVPGVGWIRWHKHVLERRKPDALLEAAKWEWSINGNRFESRTRQEGHGQRFSLQRNIQVNEGSFRLETEIRNTGDKPVHIRMFAHPFFPVPGSDGFCCVLPEGCSVQQNPGYELDGFRLIRKPSHDWKEGHFDWIYWPAGKQFEMYQKMPDGHMSVTSNYEPSTVAVWSNANTFSVEPFIERVIEPGELLEYHTTYRIED